VAADPILAKAAPVATDTLVAQEGAQKFHVPFSFDVTKTRAHVQALLTTAESARQAREAELTALRGEVGRLTQLVAHPPIVRDRRTSGGDTQPVFRNFTIELKNERTKLQAAEQALSDASFRSDALRERYERYRSTRRDPDRCARLRARLRLRPYTKIA
jgi:hypothetical protein